MNNYTCTANLVKDPELRMTQKGTPVASLRVAIDTTRKKMDGEGTETLYTTATVWGNFANVCNQNLHKGDQVTIKGELVPRTYNTRDGSKRTEIEISAQEIVFPQRPKNRYSGSEDYADNSTYNPHYLDGAEEVEDDSDLPF